mmetsp:Transcript_4072/g.18043  ORF Transcript_4072/g.18043 Transcript_4072/m.18043 type:complete len:265 (-) Transcript_4072:431-1225(-)
MPPPAQRVVLGVDLLLPDRPVDPHSPRLRLSRRRPVQPCAGNGVAETLALRPFALGALALGALVLAPLLLPRRALREELHRAKRVPRGGVLVKANHPARRLGAGAVGGAVGGSVGEPGPGRGGDPRGSLRARVVVEPALVAARSGPVRRNGTIAGRVDCWRPADAAARIRRRSLGSVRARPGRTSLGRRAGVPARVRPLGGRFGGPFPRRQPPPAPSSGGVVGGRGRRRDPGRGRRRGRGGSSGSGRVGRARVRFLSAFRFRDL